MSYNSYEEITDIIEIDFAILITLFLKIININFYGRYLGYMKGGSVMYLATSLSEGTWGTCWNNELFLIKYLIFLNISYKLLILSFSSFIYKILSQLACKTLYLINSICELI